MLAQHFNDAAGGADAGAAGVDIPEAPTLGSLQAEVERLTQVTVDQRDWIDKLTNVIEAQLAANDVTQAKIEKTNQD